MVVATTALSLRHSKNEGEEFRQARGRTRRRTRRRNKGLGGDAAVVRRLVAVARKTEEANKERRKTREKKETTKKRKEEVPRTRVDGGRRCRWWSGSQSAVRRLTRERRGIAGVVREVEGEWRGFGST